MKSYLIFNLSGAANNTENMENIKKLYTEQSQQPNENILFSNKSEKAIDYSNPYTVADYIQSILLDLPNGDGIKILPQAQCINIYDGQFLVSILRQDDKSKNDKDNTICSIVKVRKKEKENLETIYLSKEIAFFEQQSSIPQDKKGICGKLKSIAKTVATNTKAAEFLIVAGRIKNIALDKPEYTEKKNILLPCEIYLQGKVTKNNSSQLKNAFLSCASIICNVKKELLTPQHHGILTPQHHDNVSEKYSSSPHHLPTLHILQVNETTRTRSTSCSSLQNEGLHSQLGCVHSNLYHQITHQNSDTRTRSTSFSSLQNEGSHSQLGCVHSNLYHQITHQNSDTRTRSTSFSSLQNEGSHSQLRCVHSNLYHQITHQNSDTRSRSWSFGCSKSEAYDNSSIDNKKCSTSREGEANGTRGVRNLSFGCPQNENRNLYGGSHIVSNSNSCGISNKAYAREQIKV